MHLSKVKKKTRTKKPIKKKQPEKNNQSIENKNKPKIIPKEETKKEVYLVKDFHELPHHIIIREDGSPVSPVPTGEINEKKKDPLSFGEEKEVSFKEFLKEPLKIPSTEKEQEKKLDMKEPIEKKVEEKIDSTMSLDDIWKDMDKKIEEGKKEKKNELISGLNKVDMKKDNSTESKPIISNNKPDEKKKEDISQKKPTDKLNSKETDLKNKKKDELKEDKKQKKDNSIYLKVIGAILLAILLTFLLIFFWPKQHIDLYFFTTDGTPINSGQVYLDSDLIGDISEKGFVSLENTYCDTDHIVRLNSMGGEYQFSFYPVDCKYKKVEYTIKEKHITVDKVPEMITLQFVVSETNADLSGELSFDGVVHGSVTGEVKISKERCAEISKITLENPKYKVSWDNHASLCSDSEVLQFPVLEERIK
jgi:hypothetical protein